VNNLVGNSQKYQTDIIALKKLALDCGINTCTELSLRSGINRNTMGKVWNGEEQPSSNTMYKLAACLHMTPSQAGLIFFSQNLRTT